MANAKSRLLAAGTVLALLPASLAPAQQLVSTGGSFVESRLIPGGPVAGGARTIGVELTMKPGWKTYWRSPGEAGVPPRFDWSGSENVSDVEVLWPKPERFESFGYETLGYGGQVVLPVRLVPGDAGAPIGVSLSMDLGVCADICVFETAELSAVLAPVADEGAADIAAALRTVPPQGPEAGIAGAVCRIEGAGTERRVSAAIRLIEPRPVPDVVLEADGEAWAHGVTAEMSGLDLIVEADLSLATPDVWVSRAGLRFTLLGDDGYAADIDGCTGPAG